MATTQRQRHGAARTALPERWQARRPTDTYAPRVRGADGWQNPRGFPTGEKLPGGETTYVNAVWVASYAASQDCRVFYPRMIGWGGNIVALMPGGITGIRVAKSGETVDNSEVDTSGMARVTPNSLSSFCH